MLICVFNCFIWHFLVLTNQFISFLSLQVIACSAESLIFRVNFLKFILSDIGSVCCGAWPVAYKTSVQFQARDFFSMFFWIASFNWYYHRSKSVISIWKTSNSSRFWSYLVALRLKINGVIYQWNGTRSSRPHILHSLCNRTSCMLPLVYVPKVQTNIWIVWASSSRQMCTSTTRSPVRYCTIGRTCIHHSSARCSCPFIVWSVLRQLNSVWRAREVRKIYFRDMTDPVWRKKKSKRMTENGMLGWVGVLGFDGDLFVCRMHACRTRGFE